ncbi:MULTISPECIES: helix-turn-helix transcriptional regulator [unclassified Streptomyces]|uniref:helix-turn-helix domain-containing protein n=1 Tax=Streptomycetaceae TaxID=2062 RepID=UPI002E775EDD|nr:MULTISPECIES: helix-turn-helix transcriptional regulator [unclassified Streptomyces]MED7952580.1 helix-turn-helix transcriptional regulator [Streptomyces sp. BE303]MEE1822835.1 helix-turn-helix transcriptional regulator [Streptomyces sp. BE20]
MDHVLLSGGTPKGPADRLSEELQSLKSSSGLTYARISERTHYAKSSWERWVNGKQFPPRDAVERIAAVCQADERRLLELWTLAEACRTAAAAPAAARGATGGSGAPGEGDAASQDRRQMALWSLTVLALALTAGLARSVAQGRELRRGALPGGGV